MNESVGHKNEPLDNIDGYIKDCLRNKNLEMSASTQLHLISKHVSRDNNSLTKDIKTMVLCNITRQLIASSVLEIFMFEYPANLLHLDIKKIDRHRIAYRGRRQI